MGTWARAVSLHVSFPTPSFLVMMIVRTPAGAAYTVRTQLTTETGRPPTETARTVILGA